MPFRVVARKRFKIAWNIVCVLLNHASHIMDLVGSGNCHRLLAMGNQLAAHPQNALVFRLQSAARHHSAKQSAIRHSPADWSDRIARNYAIE